MTDYKHKVNRIIDIEHKKSDVALLETSEKFNLFLINSGSIILDLNGKECFVGGNVIVCTTNVDEMKLVHQSEAVVDVLHFAPEFVNVNLDWNVIRSNEYPNLCKIHKYPDFKLFLKRSPIYNGILLLNKDSHNKIREKMLEIEHQLLEQPSPKWSCQSRGLLFEIMDILDFCYKKYTNNYIEDPLVWNICQYINLNLAENLSLEFLCRAFSVNRTTLSERFKSVTGMNISTYIKSKRINRIKQLLAFTELYLSEIGVQVGYSDSTYLSKVFMRSVGKSPLKYRNEMKNTRFKPTETNISD